jgi:hypothetical protein
MFDLQYVAYSTITDKFSYRKDSFCGCCGAVDGAWLKNQPINSGYKVANKGIHIWPTKVECPPVFGVPWDVTLGGETLTVSVIEDPKPHPSMLALEAPTYTESPVTQTVLGVHFDYCNEIVPEPPPLQYSYKEYYGCDKERFTVAFGRILSLLNKTTHLCFILIDDQLPKFEACINKYKPNVNRIQYPNKIVNRNYGPEHNPRLTMLFLTLKD